MATAPIAAFFDLDGTLCTGHIWRGLSRYIRENRVNRRHYHPFMVTHMALWVGSKLRLVPPARFIQAWGRDMSVLLKGFTPHRLQEVFQVILQGEVLPTLRPDVVETLRWHQRRGHLVLLVSGTFKELLVLVGRELGVEHAVGSPLEVQDGRLTGRLAGPFCFGRYKARLVQNYLATRGLPVHWRGSYAYADRIHDRYLMELVGNPVAVYPDDALRNLAQARGWPLLEGGPAPATLPRRQE